VKKEELTARIKKLGMTKKEFSNLANIPYSTVNNWRNEKRPVPSWVDSWLNNFTYKAKFEEMQKVLKKIKV